MHHDRLINCEPDADTATTLARFRNSDMTPKCRNDVLWLALYFVINHSLKISGKDQRHNHDLPTMTLTQSSPCNLKAVVHCNQPSVRRPVSIQPNFITTYRSGQTHGIQL